MIGRLIYGRSRRDRWWRYLVLRDALVQAQGDRRPEPALIRTFRKLGYDAPDTAVVDVWRRTVLLGAVSSPVLDSASAVALENHVKTLDSSHLPVLGWLDFYHLGLGMGLYRLANAFRERAIERAVRPMGPAVNGGEDLALALYGHLEQGDYTAAGELADLLPGAGYSARKTEQARWLVDLFAGQGDGPHAGFSAQASEVDREFGRFIEGKDVALVGPVPSAREHGPDIDRHDVVVKFSYRGGHKGRDPDTQGERLDVSYYNNTQAGVLARSNFTEVLGAIAWGVCINHKGRRQFPAEQAHLRQITSFQWLLPDSHFNAGPNAVIDLLRFRPRSISVFNTDLMLSAGRYAGYRPAGVKPIEYTRSFIKTHDPVLQFKTMHRLWIQGYILGDPRFEEVMAMGLDNYLVQLQEVHGAHEQALL